jgi:hypothetical protein
MRSLRSPLPIRPLRVAASLAWRVAALLVAQPRLPAPPSPWPCCGAGCGRPGIRPRAGGQVGDADRAVGLVDVLAAGAAGAEGVDAQLGRVQLRPPRPRRARASRPPCRRWCGCGPGFGGRHALHAVAAGLEAQRLVDAARPRRAAPAPCSRPVRTGSRSGPRCASPALAVAQVHARQVAGEQRRFVAAGAGADLEEGVARVVGVARQQRGCSSACSRSRSASAAAIFFGASSPSRGRRAARARPAGRARAAGSGGSSLDHLRGLGLLARQAAPALRCRSAAAGRPDWHRVRQPQRQAFELFAQGIHGGIGRSNGPWPLAGAAPQRRGPGANARRGRHPAAGVWRRNRRETPSAPAGRARCRRRECSSAIAPCSILCVRPRASASSTWSTGSARQQLARARQLGCASRRPGDSAPGSAAPRRAGPASARSSARRRR